MSNKNMVSLQANAFLLTNFCALGMPFLTFFNIDRHTQWQTLDLNPNLGFGWITSTISQREFTEDRGSRCTWTTVYSCRVIIIFKRTMEYIIKCKIYCRYSWRNWLKSTLWRVHVGVVTGGERGEGWTRSFSVTKNSITRCQRGWQSPPPLSLTFDTAQTH